MPAHVATVVGFAVITATAVGIFVSGEDELTGDMFFDEEMQALTANTFDELNLYKGAVFFGHVNPDADAIGAALGAAEFYGGGGIAACPMQREKCPNDETLFLMNHFNVSLDSVPTLNTIPDLASRPIVLVDFNDVIKGPAKAFKDAIPPIPNWVAQSGDGWLTLPVMGSIDHHPIDLPEKKTKTPGFFYDKVGDMVVETHAWGSATTIMATKWRESGRQPSKQVAGMMLGAILSDTQGQTSSNTEQYDKDAIEYLAPLAGVEDWTKLYEEQSYAKSTPVLVKDLFEVFNADAKPFNGYIVATVPVYGEEIYNKLFERPESEWIDAMLRLQQFWDPTNSGQSLHTYVWVIDIKNHVSQVVMFRASDDTCIAQHALDRSKVAGVLTEEKECRPEAAPVPDTESFGSLTKISTGSCSSRKSQLAPLIEEAVKAYNAGNVRCDSASVMEV